MRAKAVFIILAAVLFVPAPSPAQDIRGQKPVLLLDGEFRFTPGAWGSYLIHDKKTDEYYAFTMRVLNDGTLKGRPGTWLEIDIDTGNERVVTKMLTERTASGPGELLAGIVWVEGLKPFSVPDKYLKGGDKEVGQFQVAHGAKRVDARTFTHDARQLRGFFAELTDDAGGVTRALVSEQIAPLGLVWADAPTMEMYLDDWGSGAESRIKGSPMGMRMWIMDMVMRGLAGEDVSIPKRNLPTPRIDGGWEEQDGACAGSRWTIGPGGGAAPGVSVLAHCGSTEGTAAIAAPAWKTPRIVTGRLDSPIRSGSAQIMFVSNSRAVLALKAPDGAPQAFSVLRKR